MHVCRHGGSRQRLLVLANGHAASGLLRFSRGWLLRNQDAARRSRRAVLTLRGVTVKASRLVFVASDCFSLFTPFVRSRFVFAMFLADVSTTRCLEWHFLAPTVVGRRFVFFNFFKTSVNTSSPWIAHCCSHRWWGQVLYFRLCQGGCQHIIQEFRKLFRHCRAIRLLMMIVKHMCNYLFFNDTPQMQQLGSLNNVVPNAKSS